MFTIGLRECVALRMLQQTRFMLFTLGVFVPFHFTRVIARFTSFTLFDFAKWRDSPLDT
jgi:hypothetical protein